jgi:hypothetical protein
MYSPDPCKYSRNFFFLYRNRFNISDSPQWTNQQILPSWCTINYYEYSNKVGEQFRASSSRIFVDGYTSPYRNFTNRFSLGLLENVKRQQGVEYVRASIGRGMLPFFEILFNEFVKVLN